MIPSWWGEFSSIPIFGSGSRFELVIVSLMFGGFGGSLILGGMTVGCSANSGGNARSLGGCWIIPLGYVSMTSSFSFLSGSLTTVGIAFRATGGAFTIVGTFA